MGATVPYCTGVRRGRRSFDFVQKPFEIEEMEAKVQRALELRRSGDERDHLGMPGATASESPAEMRWAR